jgi:hypothetical protein
MAETQRASASPSPAARPRRAPKTRPPHPTRYAAPLRLPVDETENLMPPVARPLPPAKQEIPDRRPAERRASARRPAVSRSPGEWTLIAALLFGLALNAGSLLINAGLSRADRLLGFSVFLGGLALLVLIEICRRTERTSR